MSEQIRESVREFADAEVAPQAEHIHRTDALVPEELITKMSELGYFGMGIPEQYGGSEMGNLAMILTTEELSRVSLAGAGSLITRPEILTKALLGGGTDEQKQQWLPRIASGEIMVGIAVTEPDVGSDVAAVKCKAEPRSVDGRDGWVINGPKSWCTFAGRANVLALLARTDPDVSKGARGLSLFIVPKDAFTGHDFEMTQPGGGRMVGKADATPGYRGMHSFTLNLENYWVPIGSPRRWRRESRDAASISRWPVLRQADSKPAAGLADSLRERWKRPPSTWWTGSSSQSRFQNSNSRSTCWVGWRPGWPALER